METGQASMSLGTLPPPEVSLCSQKRSSPLFLSTVPLPSPSAESRPRGLGPVSDRAGLSLLTPIALPPHKQGEEKKSEACKIKESLLE